MLRYPFDMLTVRSLSALLKTLRASKGNVEGLTANGKVSGNEFIKGDSFLSLIHISEPTRPY